MNKLITVCAMASLTVAPATASVREAAFASSADRTQVQSGMFAGASYTFGTGSRNRSPRGQAALKLSGMTRTSTADFRFGRGAELRLGAAGEPVLLLGGRDIGQFKRKANLSGGTVALIVVGVLAVGGVAAYYALRDECDYKECE